MFANLTDEELLAIGPELQQGYFDLKDVWERYVFEVSNRGDKIVGSERWVKVVSRSCEARKHPSLKFQDIIDSRGE